MKHARQVRPVSDERENDGEEYDVDISYFGTIFPRLVS